MAKAQALWSRSGPVAELIVPPRNPVGHTRPQRGGREDVGTEVVQSEAIDVEDGPTLRRPIVQDLHRAFVSVVEMEQSRLGAGERTSRFCWSPPRRSSRSR